MTFLRKSGSLVAVWIMSFTTVPRCSFCSGSRSHGTNSAMIHLMPRPCIKISDTAVFGTPRWASSSCTLSHRSLLIAACTRSTSSGVLLVAGLPECGSFSTDSQPSLKCLWQYFICTSLIVLSTKAFWIIQIVSVEECSSLTQNLMQNRCITRSAILNATATQYSYSLNGVYCPHWLVQWSCHCSLMCIPIRSPWLPGYMDVAQTVLILLTVAGFFLDRPYRLEAEKPVKRYNEGLN